MDWRDFIRFQPLLNEVIQNSSKNRTAKLLDHDKATINRWLDKGEPNDPDDVALLIRAALAGGLDVSPFQTYKPIYDFSEHLTYEEKLQMRPPNLDWLMAAPPPPPSPTTFCGLDIDCPVGVASSPLMADDAWAGLVLDLQFGLSAFKTRRSAFKQSWNAPQIAFVTKAPDLMAYDASTPPYVEVAYSSKGLSSVNPILNMVNSIGVPSESAEEWSGLYSRVKDHPRGRFVGISIMGDGDSKADMLKDIETLLSVSKNLRPPYIELNASCPNLEKKSGEICDDPEFLRKICICAQQILSGTGILFLLKLPWLPEPKLHQVIKKVGGVLNAIAFRNTVRVKPVVLDRDGRRQAAFPGREFGGLSGPCTLELSKRGLRRVVEFRKTLGFDFGIVAIGGVSTVSDIVEILDMGSNIVVQACTAPMFDPLLAWKVRFHLGRARTEIRKYEEDEGLLLQTPRDRIEAQSFKELHLALKEIRKRQPDTAIPYEAVKDLWNSWLESRSTQPVGIARRTTGPRNQTAWVRELSAIIKTGR